MFLAALLAASRIFITEVMANPAGGSGAHMPEDRNEFVELYNAWREAVDLADWTVNDGDAKDQLTAWQDSSVLAGNPTLRVNQTWLDPGCYAVVLDSEYTDPGPTGGYARPYRFGDSTLLMTTRNTTLGNGLADRDPLALVASSAYGFADTSTFGTPNDTADSIPCDAGDGISWERIRIDRPDTVSNWIGCLDSAGCTPGAPNSIAMFLDLAVTELSLSDSAVPDARITAAARVANPGLLAADNWSLSLYLDRNLNGRADAGEVVRSFAGWLLQPDSDSLMQAEFVCPKAKTDLWAQVTCAGDRDTLNNRRRITINPGGSGRLLNLDLSSFSPDGDGFEDALTVMYKVPVTDGRLNAAVFDLAGKQVQVLCRNLRADDERGVLFWDGRRSNGTTAPVGVYAVWLEYRQGGTTRSERLPVVLVRR
jgi:hypothetical protein